MAFQKLVKLEMEGFDEFIRPSVENLRTDSVCVIKAISKMYSYLTLIKERVEAINSGASSAKTDLEDPYSVLEGLGEMNHAICSIRNMLLELEDPDNEKIQESHSLLKTHVQSASEESRRLNEKIIKLDCKADQLKNAVEYCQNTLEDNQRRLKELNTQQKSNNDKMFVGFIVIIILQVVVITLHYI